MIEVIDLRKSFGDTEILKGISTTLDTGKINLIIGQSGSGKTVFLKSLLNVFEPTSGSILFDGRDIMKMSAKEKRQLRSEIGTVFQGSALFDSMTVEENIMFPLDMFTNFTYTEKKKRVKEVIDQVEQETGYNLLTTGMEVYTNVDQEVQKRLWDVYNTDEYVDYPDDDLQAASTIVDVTNGKVIAQLGSRHQSSNVSFGINQAVETNRDWGSTMKPITDYAPALEYGIFDSTAATINDAPYNYPGTDIPVYNWDKTYFGNITLQYAIQQSRNVPAVKTLEKVGLDHAKTFLNGLGIDYPSMVYANAISSNTVESHKQYGASSEKMAAAYAAFANGGIFYQTK